MQQRMTLVKVHFWSFLISETESAGETILAQKDGSQKILYQTILLCIVLKYNADNNFDNGQDKTIKTTNSYVRVVAVEYRHLQSVNVLLESMEPV